MTVEKNMAADGSALGEELAQLYLARKPSPAGWNERLTGLDMAYVAQDAMVQTFAASGQGTLAGYKIGMTAKSMQQLVGLDMPVGGKMLSANMMKSGAQLRKADYFHLGLESELAFVLSHDIDAPPAASDDLLAYIATAHASFEVVDDRNTDYSLLTAASLVAEDVWNVGAVLGEGVPPSALGPLDSLAGRYSENGIEVAAGMTSDVLGNPLHSLRWLAEFLLERGSMLRKGQIILTGSITAIRFPEEGTDCGFEIEGLPQVDVRIL